MAFFDEFSQKAKTFANVATEKTKEVVDSAKLTASILAEQRELDKSYRAVGEWFVSTCEEEIPEAVADIVAAAKASKERIAELQELRRKVGEDTAAEDRTCPLCGTKTDGKFCPQCGAPIGE